jgi:hypothetical protein
MLWSAPGRVRFLEPMYVPISQKVFDRRQLLVLLLAAATLVFMLVAYGGLYREYTGFGIAPEEIDLKTVIPPQQNHGRWVRITQPLELHCDRGIQESLLGKIGSTYYLAQVSGSDRSVLLDYEGNTTCEAMSRMEMTGVLEELTVRRREVLSGEGFFFPSSGVVMQLCLTCNPQQFRNMVLWSGFIPLLCLYLIIHNGRKYRQQIEARKLSGLRK